jgi:A/G-specific adenine glycosylase
MSPELLASRAGPAATDGAARAAALRRPLLAWYRRHRRPMPWRGIQDPYRIWVSEVMLQQTQVVTALPFYQSFIARFPTLAALSRAPESSVLAAWAGLGYYRRARYLREAARIVVREHGGQVPDDPLAFGRLPGVGRYTTGAVLSIAFDRSLPALDGNVARVLSRLFALPATLREPRGARALWALAGALVPARGAGEWNQAIMELGATVCLPRAPRCPECPVRRRCRALALGRVDALPPAGPRRVPERVRRAVALIERGGRLLVVRREGELLGGLWEPPGVEIAGGRAPRRALGAALARLGLEVRLSPTRHVIRHTITHREIEVEVWRGRLRAPAPRACRFADPARRELALTALARKLAALPSES